MAYNKKSRSRNRKITSASSKRMVNTALRKKGRGSIKAIWSMAKNAGRKGNIGLAVSLGNIARKRAGYAKRKKQGFQIRL